MKTVSTSGHMLGSPIAIGTTPRHNGGGGGGAEEVEAAVGEVWLGALEICFTGLGNPMLELGVAGGSRSGSGVPSVPIGDSRSTEWDLYKKMNDGPGRGS